MIRMESGYRSLTRWKIICYTGAGVGTLLSVFGFWGWMTRHQRPLVSAPKLARTARQRRP
jgi:hypothetical protein